MVGEATFVRDNEGSDQPAGSGSESKEVPETRGMNVRTWPLINLGLGVLEEG